MKCLTRADVEAAHRRSLRKRWRLYGYPEFRIPGEIVDDCASGAELVARLVPHRKERSA